MSRGIAAKIRSIPHWLHRDRGLQLHQQSRVDEALPRLLRLCVARLLAEVRLTHLVAARKFSRCSACDYPPLGENVPVVRDGERLMHVLFDEEHSNPALIDLADDVEVLLDQ